MSLVQPNGIVGRTSLRKALALFAVLVLSGGALVFAAGEARAQQQRQAPGVHATVTGSDLTPVSGTRTIEPAAGMQPSDPSQADERDAGSSFGPEPYSVVPATPEPALTLLEELYPASWNEPLSEAAMPESFGTTSGPDPTYDPFVVMLDPDSLPGPLYPVPFVDLAPPPGLADLGPTLQYPGVPGPVWGLAAFEGNKLLPSRIEEQPLPLPSAGVSEGVRPVPHGGNGGAESMLVGPWPPVADQKAPPPGLALQEPPAAGPTREELLLLSSLEAAASSAVQTLHGAAVDVSQALGSGGEALPAGSSSGGETKEPSEDAPPPPPAPLGGSYFSPSAAGQVGPGSVVPLLVCVLVAGLILLRPLVGRLSWACCELPKPNSVLLLPLERPG